MAKSKRKGKPDRRRLIITVLLVMFGICGFVGFKLANFIVYINQEPHYINSLLGDIENIYDDALVEARLLEYLTIGESTRAEVEAFGDEYLADDYFHPCLVNDETTETCYNIRRQPVFPCERRLLRIIFVFKDDILDSIEFGEDQICL